MGKLLREANRAAVFNERIVERKAFCIRGKAKGKKYPLGGRDALYRQRKGGNAIRAGLF